MNKKITFIIIVGIVVALLIFGIVRQSKKNTQTQETPSSIETGTTDVTVANTTTPQNTLPTFTLAEVAQHNSDTDCYSAIHGYVYDLTAWINQHPGGAKAIESMCGIDASDMFTQKHGQSSGAKAMLKKLHIGSLQTEMLNQIDEEASSQ